MEFVLYVSIGAVTVTLQVLILKYLIKLERRVTRIETYLATVNNRYQRVIHVTERENL